MHSENNGFWPRSLSWRANAANSSRRRSTGQKGNQEDYLYFEAKGAHAARCHAMVPSARTHSHRKEV